MDFGLIALSIILVSPAIYTQFRAVKTRDESKRRRFQWWTNILWISAIAVGALGALLSLRRPHIMAIFLWTVAIHCWAVALAAVLVSDNTRWGTPLQRRAAAIAGWTMFFGLIFLIAAHIPSPWNHD